jgi:dipeptidyl aminopeptidase/acylaminoacyl peptidase
MSKSSQFIQPLDRIAIAVMLLLSLLIGLMIWQGDAVKPSVRNFTWEKQQIGANDLSFSLTFSRPMDTKSVEENLKIDPPLAGKPSWAGRRMAYTLLTPAPYGTNYQIKLEQAKDKYSQAEGKNRLMQPFTGTFSTRNRVILYIGTNPEVQGQLVLYNLTQEQKKVLTPKDLTVMDFEPFPNGEKIVFSARPANSPDLLAAQLYTVTTGIPSQIVAETTPAGKVELILDNKEYQNLKFDLSADGQTPVTLPCGTYLPSPILMVKNP